MSKSKYNSLLKSFAWGLLSGLLTNVFLNILSDSVIAFVVPSILFIAFLLPLCKTSFHENFKLNIRSIIGFIIMVFSFCLAYISTVNFGAGSHDFLQGFIGGLIGALSIWISLWLIYGKLRLRYIILIGTLVGGALVLLSAISYTDSHLFAWYDNLGAPETTSILHPLWQACMFAVIIYEVKRMNGSKRQQYEKNN